MKQLNKILTVLTAFLLFFAFELPVKAEYKYQITILAGLHGTLDGGQEIIVTVDPDSNPKWNPRDYEGLIKVTDERFYFKGFHQSGIEDLESGMAQNIDKDMVFVAAYGLKGQTVAYTVEFVDEKEAPLGDPETRYGNVGDKPVVSYKYFENYEPIANNMTKVLTSNAAENVFRFTYRPAEPIPGGGGGGTTGDGGYTFIDDGTEVVYLPGGGGGGGNAGGNAGGGNAGGNAAPAADNANAQDAAAAADAGNDGPAEIIDLDEQEVPLVNPDTPEPEVSPSVNPKPGLNFMWILAMILSGFGIIALIAILILLLKRRKKEQPQT